MPTRFLRTAVLTSICCLAALAGPMDSSDSSPLPPAPPDNSGQLPHFGIAVGASSLGATVQAATAVAHKSNVRFGFNYFKYSDTFSKDGINYDGTLTLESAEILYDQYVAGPFHISTGLLFYDGNKGRASASVPAGQSFTLGGVTYYSQAGNTISGSGSIDSRKTSPMVLIGFGNLLPRSSRHFSVNFDVGVVFQGSTKAALHLNGGACAQPNAGCVDAATNSVIQGNVQSEQNKINNSLTPFKYYPVVSLTFGYKF